MKLIGLPFKIIIGVTLFILLIGAYYCASIFNTSSRNNNSQAIMGEIEFKGDFLLPVENFTTVTSKYGARIHPITRKAKFPYRH